MTDHQKLSRLLDLRRHEEQRRAVELAMARNALIDATDAVGRLEAQRAELDTMLADGVVDSIGQVKTARLLIEQVEQGLHNARTVQALAEATVSEKIEALEEAMQGREALERVIGPREAQARALERLAEQKAEDEAAAHRYREKPS